MDRNISGAIVLVCNLPSIEGSRKVWANEVTRQTALKEGERTEACDLIQRSSLLIIVDRLESDIKVRIAGSHPEVTGCPEKKSYCMNQAPLPSSQQSVRIGGRRW